MRVIKFLLFSFLKKLLPSEILRDISDPFEENSALGGREDLAVLSNLAGVEEGEVGHAGVLVYLFEESAEGSKFLPLK